MTTIVVDASVAAKWFLDEPGTPEAEGLIVAGHEMHAPDFLLVEMDNTFWKWVRRGTHSRALAQAGRARLRKMDLRFHEFAPLLDNAFDIASEAGASVYDALYVALAEQLNAELVTADDRLVRAMAKTRLAKRVVHVADFARRA